MRTAITLTKMETHHFENLSKNPINIYHSIVIVFTYTIEPELSDTLWDMKNVSDYQNVGLYNTIYIRYDERDKKSILDYSRLQDYTAVGLANI